MKKLRTQIGYAVFGAGSLYKYRAEGYEKLGGPVENMQHAVFRVCRAVAEALDGQDTVAGYEAKSGHGKQQGAEIKMENAHADGGAAHEAHNGSIKAERQEQLSHVKAVLFGVNKLCREGGEREGNTYHPGPGRKSVQGDKIENMAYQKSQSAAEEECAELFRVNKAQSQQLIADKAEDEAEDDEKCELGKRGHEICDKGDKDAADRCESL